MRTLRTRIASNPLAVDATLALVLTGVSLLTVAAGAQDIGAIEPLSLALLLVQTLPLVVRRTWPVAVFAVTFSAMFAHAAIATGSLSSPLGALIALYTVAERRSRRLSSTLALIAMASIAGLFIARGVLPVGLSGLIQTEVAFLVAWTLGVWAGERRLYTQAVEERAQLLEREREERAQRAVAEERDRIARELHDIVTHHVSVIVIQAGAALRALDPRPEDARTALQAIDSTGRRALADMRRMLGILGSPASSQRPAEPMPGLERLGELIEQVRGAGLPVELSVAGNPRPLDPGVELSAYRIIQEALTNALKHAHGATARVEVRYGPADLELSIIDQGGSGGRGIDVAGEPGHGLIGMRERVTMLEGRFEAGAVPGGFRVHAVLPIDTPATEPSRVGAA
jgi:signal transduction histidine kinase